MSRPRILIAEAIHSVGVDSMRRWADVVPALGLGRGELLDAVATVDAIVVKSATRVDDALMAAAPRLRAIGRAGTGTENIDLAAAERRGLPVITVPTGNTVSAAEFTVMAILALTRRLPEAMAAMAKGDYRRHLLEGRELSALTVGLVGLGKVGMETARRLAPFDCRLMAWDPRPPTDAFTALGGRLAAGFEALLPEVDVLSFHVRLTPETRHMLNGARFELLRPNCLIVNTARGAVIDDGALLNALNDGRVGGAALDVLDPEPPFDAEPGTVPFHHPLLGHPRVLATPHMAASTIDAQRRIALVLDERLQQALR